MRVRKLISKPVTFDLVRFEEKGLTRKLMAMKEKVTVPMSVFL